MQQFRETVDDDENREMIDGTRKKRINYAVSPLNTTPAPTESYVCRDQPETEIVTVLYSVTDTLSRSEIYVR